MSYARINAYDATLVIINSSDGKKYLYDLVIIKENTSVSVELSERESIPAQEQVQKESVSNDIVAQDTQFVKRDSQNSPKFSDRDNIGYHAGDLGKSEYLNQQGYYRDTGHFGTGTYFVGDEQKITGNSCDIRPHHAVDFSNYNLYKVKNDKDGYSDCANHRLNMWF